MEITRKLVRGERAKSILQLSSSNLPRKTQQSKSLTVFPQRPDTRYRACTGETYELAQLPRPATTSSLEQSRVVKELNDRDTGLSDSSSSVQIDTPPDSAASLGLLDNILNSSADLEQSVRLYRAVGSGGRHSLVPINSRTNKRRPATPEDAIQDIHEILLKVASEYPAMASQLFNAMGLEKGWGTGPYLDKTVFSAFDQKLLQLELVARSNSSSTEHKTYAVGFDTRLFSQMFSGNPRVTKSDSCNNENNCFGAAKICPYRVIATQEVFQSYVNTIILPRKSAYGELCERLHPHSADQAEVGLEFKQVAGTFFAGKEVPKDFTYGQFENRTSFQIISKGGDRTKVLDMKPLDDHTLVIFLEDCVMSNDLAAAESKKSKLFGMDIIKGDLPSYDSLFKVEVLTTGFTIVSSDHSSNHASDDESFREQLKTLDEHRIFAKANALKKFLAEIPGAVEGIPSLDAEGLQRKDIAQDNKMAVLNSSDAIGLAAATHHGAAAGQSKPNKPKKKKSKKSQKKSAGRSHLSKEDYDLQESTLNDSSNLGDALESSSGQNPGNEEVPLSENKLSQTVPTALFNQEDGSKKLESTLRGLEVEDEYDGSDGSDCWETVQPKGHKRGISHMEKATENPQISASTQKKSSNSLARTVQKTFARVVSTPSNATPFRTGSLASNTSKGVNGLQPSTTGKAAKQNNNYKNKKPPREESFDESFPPLTSRFQITTPPRNEKEMKKPSHRRESDSSCDSRKLESSEEKSSAVKPSVVTVLNPTLSSSQPDEINVKAEALKENLELAMGVSSTPTADSNEAINKTKSVSQGLLQESIGDTNAHVSPSPAPNHSASGSFGQRRNKKPKKGGASASQYRGTNSKGQKSRTTSIDNLGQHTRHGSRTSLEISSDPSTAAKGESTVNQVQSSALPCSKDQLEPESTKQVVLTQRVESRLQDSQLLDAMKPNGSYVSHDLNPTATGSLFRTEPEERIAGTGSLASLGPASASTEIKQEITMELKLETTTTVLLPKSAVINYTAEGVESVTPSSLVSGFAGVDKETETAVVEEVNDMEQGVSDAGKPLSLPIKGDIRGSGVLSNPLAWANLLERTKLRSRRYSLEDRQGEFDHKQVSASIRSKSEEPKDRVRFGSPSLSSSIMLHEETQGYTNGHFQTLAPHATASISYEGFQQDGAILLPNTMNFSSFHNAQEDSISGPRNTTHPPAAPIFNLGNTITYIGHHHNVSGTYSRYHGSGNNMATADTHAHPIASSEFPFGNTRYLPPTNRDPALKSAHQVLRYSLQDWNCTFCLGRFHPSTENPAHFCPFCISQGLIMYCSTSCQLADSYDHCAGCQHNPSYERIYTPLVAPTAMRRIENYPIQSQSYEPVIPECYRQKAFSMFCRTGKFPDIMGSWNRVKKYEGNKVSTPDSNKHVGDYFIFRSGLTSRLSNQAPVDVICSVILDPNDAMKLPLRRMLNACYIRPTPTFTRFLFRFIRHIISDYNIFNYMTSVTSYASQADIVLEFDQQFSREFSFLPGNPSDQQPFSFRPEWEWIRPTLEQFERENPMLGYWKTRDAACQLYW